MKRSSGRSFVIGCFLWGAWCGTDVAACPDGVLFYCDHYRRCQSCQPGVSVLCRGICPHRTCTSNSSQSTTTGFVRCAQGGRGSCSAHALRTPLRTLLRTLQRSIQTTTVPPVSRVETARQLIPRCRTNPDVTHAPRAQPASWARVLLSHQLRPWAPAPRNQRCAVVSCGLPTQTGHSPQTILPHTPTSLPCPAKTPHPRYSSVEPLLPKKLGRGTPASWTITGCWLCRDCVEGSCLQGPLAPPS